MKTLDELTEEYEKWCEEHNFPLMSADELLYQLVSSDDARSYEESIEWLVDFMDRWIALDGGDTLIDYHLLAEGVSSR